MQEIAMLALVVRDYDEAIEYFTSLLDFELVEDSDLGGGKRWVVIAPPGGNGARLLLARAVSQSQQARIGDQTGGRVFLFLTTDDLKRDHTRMVSRGVKFTQAPRNEAYGTVAVFEDLYGNRWDLIQQNA
jgi:catechol 2,3-dioxygenase-like lactoylglutathione lyase family enzyme